MQHAIIGTAGHVDHGKSSLIAALTGCDPDRLDEEKKRGITIELGFASLDLPDGGKAGIVDVPGHERFVRHMLAGAGGMDLVLFMVAADEGVMPQTKEHLDILQLLDVREGLIVMTKIDLADEEWQELAEEDIRDAVKGSFLESAPIYRVSSRTGEGIEALREEIFRRIQTLPERKSSSAFRLPIDRVFTLGGHGTIVTGTLIEGSLRQGETVSLYPEGREARVRSLQVHGTEVAEAMAGQRLAINLAQLSKEDILRGDVLASRGSMDISTFLDVSVSILKDSPYSVKNGSKLHLHVGSAAILARIRLLGKEELKPGEIGTARLILEEGVALKYGDRFVLRFFSPMETVGGGYVLDPDPKTLRIREELWGAHLERLVSADPIERLCMAVDTGSPVFASLDSAIRRSGVSALPPEEQEEILKQGLASGEVLELTPQIWLSSAFLKTMGEKSLGILEKYHTENPLKAGLKREELRTRLLPEIKIEWTDKLLEHLIRLGYLKDQEGLISAPDFQVCLSDEQKKIARDMEALYKETGFAPPDTDEVLSRFPNKQNPGAVLSQLIDSGVLCRLDAQICMHREVVEEARAYTLSYILENGSMKLADFRDHIGSSRKFAVAILDSFDREKLTRLEGDARVLLS